MAAVNSLVAYLYGHLNQSTLDLPVNPDGSPSVTCGTAITCGVTDNGAVLECPDAQLLTNVVRESEKAVPQSGPVKVLLLRQHRIPLPPLTTQPKTSSTRASRRSQARLATSRKRIPAVRRKATAPEAGTVVGMDAPSDGDYWNHNTAYHAGWPLSPPNTTTTMSLTSVVATAFSPSGSRSVTATPARNCSTSSRSWVRRTVLPILPALARR